MNNKSQGRAVPSFSPFANTSTKLLLNALPDAVLALDKDGEVQFLNPEAQELLRVSPDQAAGRHWSRLLRIYEVNRNGGGPLRLLTAAKRTATDNERYFQIALHDGTQRIVRIRALEDAAGSVNEDMKLFLLQDFTDTYTELQELRWQSAHDHLTKLVNRWEFERRLRRVVRHAQRNGSQHVLMFMDLDGFKPINDEHGHPAGDAVLKDVARILSRHVRERDSLGRLGGDEFGLLMEHCTVTEGLRVANALLDALRRRQFSSGGARFRVCLSIGMVTIDQSSNSLATKMAEADAACYQAKRNGGDQVIFNQTEACTSVDTVQFAG